MPRLCLGRTATVRPRPGGAAGKTGARKGLRPDAAGRQGTGPSDEKATIAQNATREKPPGTTVIAGMQGRGSKAENGGVYG